MILIISVEKSTSDPSTHPTTLKYLAQYFEPFKHYSYAEEQRKLDERAESCPIAKCYSIISRGLIGKEYGLVEV